MKIKDKVLKGFKDDKWVLSGSDKSLINLGVELTLAEVGTVIDEVDLGLMFTDIKDKKGKKFELSDELMDLFGTFWTIHLEPLIKQKLGIK